MIEGLSGISGQPDPAGLAPAARVHLGLDDHLAAQPTGNRFGFGGCGRHIAIQHRYACCLEQGARLIFVQIHNAAMMVVPVSPRSAAGPWERRAIIARRPPWRTNAAAASTLGFMPPASSVPPATMLSASSSVILRMARAAGVPQPSNTASTLVRII